METKELENKATDVVGAVIFNRRKDSFLAGQRAKTKRFPLKWEFIGGKVEQDEGLEQAIKREMNEEVGLSIEVVGEIAQVEHNYGGNVGKIRVHFIECLPKGNVVLRNFNKEVYNDFKWIKLDEVPEIDWIEADKEFASSLAVKLTSTVPSLN